jgi:hypothetical protein
MSQEHEWFLVAQHTRNVCSTVFMAFVYEGNDLARVLRWGPGYNGGESPLNLLRDVIDAEEIKLDRYVGNYSIECMRVRVSSISNTLQRI